MNKRVQQLAQPKELLNPQPSTINARSPPTPNLQPSTPNSRPQTVNLNTLTSKDLCTSNAPKPSTRHRNPQAPDGNPQAQQPQSNKSIVPLKWIEYGFGYIIIRSPYTPYSIYLRWTARVFLAIPLYYALGSPRTSYAAVNPLNPKTLNPQTLKSPTLQPLNPKP